MKKIIITSNTSWFIHNFFKASIIEFLNAGHKVYVLAPLDKYSSQLEDLGCSYSAVGVDRSGARISSEVSTLYSLYKHISQIKPDVVLNFTPKMNIYSTLVSRVLGVKVINSVAGLGSIFTEKGLKSKLGKVLLKLTQPLAHHVVFQNNEDKEIYLANRLVVSEKCSRVHGIGLDLASFPVHHSIDDNCTRFILVARMLKNKGVIDFVEAAKKVTQHYNLKNAINVKKVNVEFSLLGFVDEQNPQRITYEQLMEWDANSGVNYLGETDDVFSIVKDQDCVVLPSFYREGLPQCLIEACSMGKPIITTHNVGCRDAVDDGVNGILVKPKSQDELVSAMVAIVESGHQQRVDMGMLGRKKAETEFCHLKISKHYLDIINRVCL
ncbi:glycosyltransferase family 4 protein [Shewanella olleyana]|uniref:glycosyltransferase family 4 protein n=1 Tax=Shewanella olleyana TaxID=135626 RepID=UPI00200DF00A|nr:glycosyltransferase family 4 protein [Shewanella olleyana]MCL1067027.1 glycosyltransferase family 4 protein [Shewanella olleyana]